MNKQAVSGMDNSRTRFPIPFMGDINNRRFVTAVLAGVLGGAGVSAAANLLRAYRELRGQKKETTDDKTIVLTLPAAKKAASGGYEGMRDAKPGEAKVTANGGRQMRDAGKYGKKLSPEPADKEAVKCAKGNPGPDSVGTMVANALGITAGGLVSYEIVSRLFDAMHERRLKRKLEAAQQAYVNAMAGASKRAEAVMSVIGPVERAVGCAEVKEAGILDLFPDTAANVVRYPAAMYILALLAGTGATAYVTKKVMDREFPEEKLDHGINRPTRIVFRTEGAEPKLLEGDKGKEKKASAETCAAITALLPVYMDVVEGAPNRTLAAPYVKIAAAAGTDPAGLMKMAKADLGQAYKVVLQDPAALWEILKGTNFGLDFNRLNAAHVLRATRPDTYRAAVDAAIDANFAGGPNDGLMRRLWNSIARAGVHAYARLGGRDSLVDRTLKSAEDDDYLHTNYLGLAVFNRGKARGKDEDTAELPEPAAVVAKARKRLRKRRGVSVEAGDARAAKYVRDNQDRIRKLLARLNAQGAI